MAKPRVFFFLVFLFGILFTSVGASLVAAVQETWVRKIPWRREWNPTPVFLPEGFHGQRNLKGYSPWGHRESD